jgi:glycosyltransferase involved in cell wall biosynthesis
VTVIVADNNSKDDTAEMVRAMQAEATRPLVYLKEVRQSSSYARNAGIEAGTGELIGFIDDDEEIDQHWYEVVAREFRDESVQFIGGPYLPNWAAPPPAWLPPGYHAVIGVVEPKPRSAFGGSFAGNLMSGNAVVRRTAFERIGMYNTRLGRSGKGLLAEEDADFYRRLRAANIHGMYVPDLIIYHYIPTARLTRNYHRRWSYWRAVSQGIADKDGREPVAYVLGVPRYKIGRAIKGLTSIPRRLVSAKRAGQNFADELAVWDLLGFIHGRHFARIDKYYAEQ